MADLPVDPRLKLAHDLGAAVMSLPTTELEALVAAVRWAQDHAEHHPGCNVGDCRCGLDEALAPFGADRG